MSAPGPTIALASLMKPDDHLLVREDEARLLVAVTRVVDAGAEDLARVREGREDAVDHHGVGCVGGRGCVLESPLAVADERERVRVPSREHLAVHLDSAPGRVAEGELDDPHRCAPFVVPNPWRARA